MAATGGAAGVHLVHQKRDTIVARRWHLEGTWMSKKMAADHIKLKRAYEPPAPDERTGLCFRESEVKAYDDALKSCGWGPPFFKGGGAAFVFFFFSPVLGVSFPGRFSF